MSKSKISVKELHQKLIAAWGNLVEKEISREEFDLLTHTLFTEKDGWIKTYSICTPSDFVEETWDRLRSRILNKDKSLKIDPKIRFFHDAGFELKTQREIESIIDEIYRKPVPVEQICVSKRVVVHSGDKQEVIDSILAKAVSKAVVENAPENKLRWIKDKNGNLAKAAYTINTQLEMEEVFHSLKTSSSKTIKNGYDRFMQALCQTCEIEEGNGVTFYFATKAPPVERTPEPNKKNKPKFYSQLQLKERGWTATLIEKHLGEPDTYFYNMKNPYSPTHGYLTTRVHTVEKRSVFKADLEARPKTKKGD